MKAITKIQIIETLFQFLLIQLKGYFIITYFCL